MLLASPPANPPANPPAAPLPSSWPRRLLDISHGFMPSFLSDGFF